MDGSRRLTHPLLVGAVAILAVNDHVLKARWPNLLTGKLSDVAGLFVVAAALAVIAGGADAGARSRRALVAVCAAGAAFTLLKLAPPLADRAAPLLGGPTAADPTDLLALPILYPAYRFATGAGTGQPAVGVVRSQRADGLRLLAATLALTAGTFSVTATSCLEAERVSGFALVPEGLVAGISEPYSGGGGGGGGETGTYLLSTDGGRSWAPWTPPTAVPPVLVSQEQVCVDNTGCYRVVDNNRVERRDPNADGQWHIAFTFTAEQLRRMNLRADSCSGRGDPDGMFAFLTPTGPTTPTDPNRPTVVVAMGTQGVLRLDPDTGQWDRIAVGPTEPLSLRGPSWLADLSLLPLLFLLVTPALYLVKRARRSRRQRLVLAAVSTGVAATIGLATLAVWIVTLGAVDYALFGMAVAVTSVAAFLVSLAVALR